MTTLDKISHSRTRLLLDSPWFGSLCMRLRVEEGDCKTMQTDGTRLQFNPQTVDEWTGAELTGVLAHEVMHCALLHPYRKGGRDHKLWNQACDYAINQILATQGFTMPKGVLLDPRFADMGAEQIYAILEKEQQEKQDEPGGSSEGEGEGEDEQPGQVVAPQPGDGDGQQGGSGEQEMTATDWQIATEQATAIAKKAGRLPGDADRAVQANRASETNWREILRRFVEQTVPSDYSWTMPNRRYISAGIYLPGTLRENMPRLAVAVDTSGSIGSAELEIFAAELTQILHEARPEGIDVIYCDVAVKHAESFFPDDPEIKLAAQGGGGTAFQPVFDHVATQNDTPAALIYFTDLDGPAPQQPEYPVLWVTTEATNRDGFFGETVRLSKWQ
jgi:predicted metal-dependent peptidase